MMQNDDLLMQLLCNLESMNIETDDTGAFVQQKGTF